MSQGKAFYGVLFLEAVAASGLVLIPGLPLVSVVLVVNVIAVLAMPPALIFLFMLVNDREIMGDYTSPRWANVLASHRRNSAGRRGNTLRNQRHRAQPVRADRREIACLKSQSRMPNPATAENSAWVMQSLEAGQLASARAKHYPRRPLKRSEAILFWGLRIYLLFMMGVVCYQVWTTTH